MAFRLRSIALSALAGLAIASAALPAAAQGYHAPGYHSPVPGIDHAQRRQAQMERHGVATGRITPQEERRINHARRNLARHEAQARRDGYVSPRERQELRRHAQQVNGMIRHEMADGQRW